MDARARDAVLITGGSGFIGRFLTAELIRRGRRLILLCRPSSMARLQARLDAGPGGPLRPEIVAGDITLPDLGLARDDAARLRDAVGEVLHLAASYRLSMKEDEARAVNVDGTHRVLEFAAGLPGLRAFHHVSSIAVSGDFEGDFGEDDLDRGQGFFHAYGKSKFESEKAVRGSGLPWRVFRPGVVVGHSRTGEADKVDGAYYLFRVLHRLARLPLMARLPMLGMREDDVFFPLVPVDFLASAMAELMTAPARSAFHLVDPYPLSYREFYERSLRAFGFSGPVLHRPVRRLARLLMLPPIRPAAAAAAGRLGLPLEMVGHVLYRVRYDDARAREALAGSGISCPPFPSYLPRLVEYFRSAPETLAGR